MAKNVAVLLAGCGVYDGSEIHEAVFTLLSLNQQGIAYQCVAPDRNQHHVINHLNGEEQAQQRNILEESARIARGEVTPLDQAQIANYDALVIPGGFGAAKNLNQWALSGPEGQIFDDVKTLIVAFAKAGKPIVGLCMGPTVIAKALADANIKPELTVGSSQQSSPYDIKGIHQGMESIGMHTAEATLDEILIDEQHKIITAPCYMMEGEISAIYNNIAKAMQQLNKWL